MGRVYFFLTYLFYHKFLQRSLHIPFNPSCHPDRVELELELRNPKDYEIGLLLLLLKDLWTGDLPIGGESSIGRGRLQGLSAEISRKSEYWEIKEGGQVTEDVQKKLEGFVKALNNKVKEVNK